MPESSGSPPDEWVIDERSGVAGLRLTAGLPPAPSGCGPLGHSLRSRRFGDELSCPRANLGNPGDVGRWASHPLALKKGKEKMGKEQKHLVPAEVGTTPEKPNAVVEAEEALQRWGLTLAGTGTAGSIAYWFAVLQFDLFLPIQWWFVFMITLVALFFFPPNRGPRNSRELLRRWDDLGIQKALEEGGVSPDPKVRVAEEMAQRVAGHPHADPPVRRAASDLLSAVRQTAQDRRTIRLLQQSGAWEGPDTRERTLSDVLDFLSGREGELLGSLEKLHRAVVKRDASAAAELSLEARDLLAHMEAEEEVEKLLRKGD